MHSDSIPIKNVRNTNLFLTFFIGDIGQGIQDKSVVSYIPTYEDEMMHKAYQTYRYFPLFKHTAVYFPPSAQQRPGCQ